jgi:biopolymer transport protein ExbD
METPRFFDVWLTEANAVYQRVPLSVAADWLEEGRLLVSDRVRPAGQVQTPWQPISAVEALAVFAGGGAAADGDDGPPPDVVIEPVRPTGPPAEAEDDEVDMIPLIDISLVLLIFFMMTGALVSGSVVDAPEAKSGNKVEGGITVALQIQGGGSDLKYFLDNKPVEPNTEAAFLQQFEERLKAAAGPDPQIIVLAHPEANFDPIFDLMRKMQAKGAKKFLAKVQDKKE